MAFEQLPVITPTRIGEVRVQLISPDPESEETGGIYHTIDVWFDNGTVYQVTGELTSHLSPEIVNSLVVFMLALRAQAESQILPPGEEEE